MFFTSLPVVFYGIFDQDVSRKTAFNHPMLYWTGHDNSYFNTRRFLRWVAEGVFNSLIIFFFPYGFFESTSVLERGESLGLWSFGTCVYTGLILTVTLRLALESAYITIWNHIALWGSITLWFVFILIYTAMNPGAAGELDNQDNVFQLIYVLFDAPAFWLSIVFVPTFCLLPVVAEKHIYRTFLPSTADIYQEQDAEARRENRSNSYHATSTHEERGSKAGLLKKFLEGIKIVKSSKGEEEAYTGYGFSQEPGNYPYPLSSSDMRKNYDSETETDSYDSSPRKSRGSSGFTSWFRK
eukprot:GFYU01020184.1.p1 GENE.GFYU01020184.1~~GFYU01020184.1.p1  ORF type:complete len:331 (-),score=104.06 GFYU01020184.1:21-911(-)